MAAVLVVAAFAFWAETAVARARAQPTRTIFSSGFESGAFSGWTVQLAGDGTAAVQSAIVGAGSLAAELSESSHRGSRADLRKTFSARYPGLTASGRFRVLKQGPSRVPLFRFFSARWNRVATVYRQNRSISVAYGRRHFSTRGALPLNRWASISLHVITKGARSTVEVRLNGRPIYHTKRARLGRRGVSTVQVGDDFSGHEFRMVVDTIRVQSRASAMPSPPVNTGLPVVAGLRQQGHRVSVSAGSWTGKQPTRYRFRWFRCDSRGRHCRQIAGATRRTYLLGSADVGSSLRVVVTASNSVGRATVTSAATTVVQSAPANKTLPTIQGTPQDGQTLTANPGTWRGTRPMDYAYRWLRCDAGGANCAAIATGSSYVAVAADVGSTLRVDVTATNSAGSATARSPVVRPAAAPPANPAAPTVQPAAGPPANTAPPTIQGTPEKGQTLNTNPGTWAGTPPITYAYQWLRCNSGGNSCVVITGATSAMYAATSGDVGSTLRVDVTATNAGGHATATSNATLVVQVSSSVTVALWHMNEPAGSTTMMDSVGTDDGTLFHVTAGLAGSSGNPGDLAYGFNGSSSYVSVPSAGALNPGSANVTITIHLQTTGTPPAPPADWDLFRKGDYVTGGSEYKMEFQQSGQASCGFEGSGGYSELIAGPQLNDGQWHTIQCVKTASQIEVVVDGVAYSQPAALGAIANTSPVTIGSHPGSDWYSGALDEASIQIG